MDNGSIRAIIFERFLQGPQYELFCYKDFEKLGSKETIRKVFHQACSEGVIKQVCRGFYTRPVLTRFGEVWPSLEAIAKAIAKRDGVLIMPSGAAAANLLGLSTQVPMQAVYLTTGSTRKVPVGERFIFFRHVAPKYFAYKGVSMPLIVQALRFIGRRNVGNEEIAALATYISQTKDCDILIKDLQLAPVWIQNLLRPLLAHINRA